MSGERRCGDCTACCTVLGVVELGKPAFTPCGSCRTRPPFGCAIYATRPAECATFRCGWLEGVGTNADRPDRSGVVLSVTKSESLGMEIVQLHELRDGTTQTGRGAALLRLSLTGAPLVVVLRPDGRRTLHGEPSIIRKVDDLLAKTGKSPGDVGWIR
jgi:hypothetical protein